MSMLRVDRTMIAFIVSQWTSQQTISITPFLDDNSNHLLYFQRKYTFQVISPCIVIRRDHTRSMKNIGRVFDVFCIDKIIGHDSHAW